jgi:hypothetical protein
LRRTQKPAAPSIPPIPAAPKLVSQRLGLHECSCSVFWSAPSLHEQASVGTASNSGNPSSKRVIDLRHDM